MTNYPLDGTGVWSASLRYGDPAAITESVAELEQLRLGFTDDDVADGGSDRLVDALVAWGDESAIVARIDEHRAAGADHVGIQVLASDGGIGMAELRALAPAVAPH